MAYHSCSLGAVAPHHTKDGFAEPTKLSLPKAHGPCNSAIVVTRGAASQSAVATITVWYEETEDQATKKKKYMMYEGVVVIDDENGKLRVRFWKRVTTLFTPST